MHNVSLRNILEIGTCTPCFFYEICLLQEGTEQARYLLGNTKPYLSQGILLYACKPIAQGGRILKPVHGNEDLNCSPVCSVIPRWCTADQCWGEYYIVTVRSAYIP